MTTKKNAKPSFYDAMDDANSAYERLEDEAYATGFAGALAIALKCGCPVATIEKTMVESGMSLAHMKDAGAAGYDYEQLCKSLKETKAKPKVSKPKRKSP